MLTPVWEEGCSKYKLFTQGFFHSSILAWRIPWTEEPGGLYSPWVAKVRHDLMTKQQQHRELKLLWISESLFVSV